MSRAVIDGKDVIGTVLTFISVVMRLCFFLTEAAFFFGRLVVKIESSSRT